MIFFFKYCSSNVTHRLTVISIDSRKYPLCARTRGRRIKSVVKFFLQPINCWAALKKEGEEEKKLSPHQNLNVLMHSEKSYKSRLKNTLPRGVCLAESLVKHHSCELNLHLNLVRYQINGWYTKRERKTNEFSK